MEYVSYVHQVSKISFKTQIRVVQTCIHCGICVEFWKEGSLSPWSQSLVVAMLKFNSSKKLSFSYAEIAEHVSKVGGGHPLKQVIYALHGSTKKDKHWYLGKVKPDAKKRGPKNKFGMAQMHVVANSAMALKRFVWSPKWLLLWHGVQVLQQIQLQERPSHFQP